MFFRWDRIQGHRNRQFETAALRLAEPASVHQLLSLNPA